MILSVTVNQNAASMGARELARKDQMVCDDFISFFALL